MEGVGEGRVEVGGAGAPGSGQWEGGKELVIRREGIYKAGEGRRGSKWKEGQERRSSSSFFSKQDKEFRLEL